MFFGYFLAIVMFLFVRTWKISDLENKNKHCNQNDSWWADINTSTSINTTINTTTHTDTYTSTLRDDTRQKEKMRNLHNGLQRKI